MIQTAINYAKALYDLAVPEEIISETEQIFTEVSEVKLSLISPVVPFKEKSNVIKRIFHEQMHPFLKVVCKNGSMGLIDNIFKAYRIYEKQQKQILTAVLSYVTKPSDEQIGQIREFLMKKYQKRDIELTIKQDSRLLGGFVLKVGSDEFDWSMRRRFVRLKRELTGR